MHKSIYTKPSTLCLDLGGFCAPALGLSLVGTATCWANQSVQPSLVVPLTRMEGMNGEDNPTPPHPHHPNPQPRGQSQERLVLWAAGKG